MLNTHTQNCHYHPVKLRVPENGGEKCVCGCVSEHVDYTSFGMTIPGKSWTASGTGYRWGFQAQESDNELFGDGNASFFKYRISDNRIGRFFAVDPLAPEYPWNSPYAFSENDNIRCIELEGLERIIVEGNGKDILGKSFLQIYATQRGKEMLTHMTSQPSFSRSTNWDFTYSKVFFSENVGYNYLSRSITWTGWSILGRINEGVAFPTFVIVGHEAGHAFRHLTGRLNIRDAKEEERQNSHFENYLRDVYGYSLRETYSFADGTVVNLITTGVNDDNEKVSNFESFGSLELLGFMFASWESSSNSNNKTKNWALITIDDKGFVSFIAFDREDDFKNAVQEIIDDL